MAVDMFIKIEGVEGESQDAKHEKEIDVLAWSWGMSQSGSFHTGGGGGGGKVSVQDLSFTKYVDKSSPILMQYCCNGSHIQGGQADRPQGRRQEAAGVPRHHHDRRDSSRRFAPGARGGEDRLTENVSLNFAAVKVDYQPQKPDGSKDGGPVKYGWDIAANKEAK